MILSYRFFIEKISSVIHLHSHSIEFLMLGSFSSFCFISSYIKKILNSKKIKEINHNTIEVKKIYNIVYLPLSALAPLILPMSGLESFQVRDPPPKESPTPTPSPSPTWPRAHACVCKL